MASICSSDSAERLASVRLRTFLPSRYDSRSRYVGLELRFGTPSIWHGHIIPLITLSNNLFITTTWLHNASKKATTSRTNLGNSRLFDNLNSEKRGRTPA